VAVGVLQAAGRRAHRDSRLLRLPDIRIHAHAGLPDGRVRINKVAPKFCLAISILFCRFAMMAGNWVCLQSPAFVTQAPFGLQSTPWLPSAASVRKHYS
jgi:hypothetical protein